MPNRRLLFYGLEIIIFIIEGKKTPLILLIVLISIRNYVYMKKLYFYTITYMNTWISSQNIKI